MEKRKYNYQIWLGSFEDVLKFYYENENNSLDWSQLRLEDFGVIPLSLMINGNRRSKFSLEEIDYITSSHTNEHSLYERLFGELSETKEEKITVTHCYRGLCNDIIIYDNSLIQKYSSEVLDKLNKGVSREEITLSDSDELKDFYKELLRSTADPKFVLLARIANVNPKVVLLIEEYCSDREITNMEKAILEEKIYSHLHNYRTLRALSVAVLELKNKIKRNDMSIENIKKRQALKREVQAGPFENPILAKHFYEDGTRGVISNMSSTDLRNCSKNDLRRAGVLPYEFFESEYNSYDERKRLRSLVEDSSMSSKSNDVLKSDGKQALGLCDLCKDPDEAYGTYDIDELAQFPAADLAKIGLPNLSAAPKVKVKK